MRLSTDDWESYIGNQIKRARLDANLTQEAVASRCGLSALTVAKLEAGRGSRLSTLIKVLKVLGMENQLETLVPVTPISPIRMKQQGHVRQRARSKRKPSNS